MYMLLYYVPYDASQSTAACLQYVNIVDHRRV